MRIMVINPNSDPVMTADIDKAARAYAKDRFEAVTVATDGAPRFIDYYEDDMEAAPGMVRIIRENEKNTDAFIVACHCDPNLALMRQITDRPVLGIGEVSMKLATMLGGKFSVIVTSEHSLAQKQLLVHTYGLDANLASIRIRDPKITDEKAAYLDAARKAINEDYAEVIVLGCAGLCTLADDMTRILGIPVIDGVTAALAAAEGIVNAGYMTSKARLYRGRE